ncbi:putative bifunctional p-450:nadph-p450 reductase protein [Neofusicoccum parvum UCRNP2]|uniref:Putative bifunctional p-450:nadph-p450 reductase protein n=1 Tax=Botryosphaeria parva (strain UCR-NP2) TaxID=1287680 RepID=R1GR17_BOTPV|nr:putative bifunctional p-450:nadph-p450 reductase protein [Neofusicoccum parvum UCRNP2]
MNSWLKDADKQSSRPEFVNNLRILAMKKFEADIKTMRTICQDIVDQRRKQPVEAPDLLNSLLYNKDPKSGEGLSDGSIIDNMITFLVAGHETTSGLLSFAFYYLLKNPEAFAKARQEVDEVVGAGPIDVAHLPQLKYISALMRETLRLMPTAPGYTVGAREDTVIALTLQVFDLELDDPTYDLKVKESLTLKPDGFFMRASLRRHKTKKHLLQPEKSAEPKDLSGVSYAVFGCADLFSSYVELAQPATPRNIRTLVDASSDDETKKSLLSLASTEYATEIRDKRVSVLELLERFPNLAVPVETFLSTLPVLRHRLYSISSSPTWQPSHASLTFSVVDAPARSGAADARFLGVASNHFLDLTPGAVVRISLRTTNPRFRPPPDPLATPVVLLAAGAGLAPFRAFVQDRAERLRGGSALAPALLLFGCRGPRLDDLYREELDAFEAEGVVSVRRAYSREPGHADAAGCAYVQERLWREREEVLGLWERGAVVYVCGGTGMAEAVKEAVARIVGEGRDGPGGLVVDPAAWVASLEPKRYIAEVFA